MLITNEQFTLIAWKEKNDLRKRQIRVYIGCLLSASMKLMKREKKKD